LVIGQDDRSNFMKDPYAKWIWLKFNTVTCIMQVTVLSVWNNVPTCSCMLNEKGLLGESLKRAGTFYCQPRGAFGWTAPYLSLFRFTIER